MKIKFYLLLALFFVLVLFAVQNAGVVSVKFLFWKFEASRAIVIAGSILFGVLVGWLLPRSKF